MFDRVIIVDWSAASTPKRGADSIWSYATDELTAVNHPTRHDAFESMVKRLRRPGCTLVGFDFPFGYPAGFAARAHLIGEPPWRAAWQHLTNHIVDDERNRNNRWDVAASLNERIGERWFWGVPQSYINRHLMPYKTIMDWTEFRLVERRLRDYNRRPFSARHLLGAGSVGSQTLTGIPVVQRLRDHPDLAPRARIWPFETGLTGDPADGDANAIVLAEVWPSWTAFDTVAHRIKDARQVIALASRLAALDAKGHLRALFAPELTGDETRAVVDEEGWILGVQ